MDDATLFRTASVSVVIAVGTLIVAGITIAFFFGGMGRYWGPINDVFVSATAVALLLPILALVRAVGDGTPWFRIVSYAALAGCVLIAVGQVLLVVSVIDLNASFWTGGLGVIPVIAWMVALVILGLGGAAVPALIGWSSLAALAAIGVTILVGMIGQGAPFWIACGVLLLGLVAWLGALAIGLLQLAPAAAQ